MTRKTRRKTEREIERLRDRADRHPAGAGATKAMVGCDPHRLPGVPEKAREWAKQSPRVDVYESEAEAREAGLSPGSTIGWDPTEADHEVPRPGEEETDGETEVK